MLVRLLCHNTNSGKNGSLVASTSAAVFSSIVVDTEDSCKIDWQLWARGPSDEPASIISSWFNFLTALRYAYIIRPFLSGAIVIKKVQKPQSSWHYNNGMAKHYGVTPTDICN